jgi:hypothetical protein
VPVAIVTVDEIDRYRLTETLHAAAPASMPGFANVERAVIGTGQMGDRCAYHAAMRTGMLLACRPSLPCALTKS